MVKPVKNVAMQAQVCLFGSSSFRAQVAKGVSWRSFSFQFGDIAWRLDRFLKQIQFNFDDLATPMCVQHGSDTLPVPNQVNGALPAPIHY